MFPIFPIFPIILRLLGPGGLKTPKILEKLKNEKKKPKVFELFQQKSLEKFEKPKEFYAFQ